MNVHYRLFIIIIQLVQDQNTSLQSCAIKIHFQNMTFPTNAFYFYKQKVHTVSPA